MMLCDKQLEVGLIACSSLCNSMQANSDMWRNESLLGAQKKTTKVRKTYAAYTATFSP